ncbi:MAG: restriction endonuclease subunit S [Methylomicrobium sp.]
MELIPGYKQTEMGLIPNDWELRKLEDISTISRLAGAEYTSLWEETTNGEIIALRGFNIGRGRIIEKDFVRISNELSLKLKRSRLCKGDVIYPCVGSIGNAVVINEDNKYHIQQNIARITPNSAAICSKYLANFLMSSLGEMEVSRFNASSSQPNVLVGSLRQYRIPLPPTKAEQEAIAEVLSDADALIESLEQLIAKKRQIKQGTMRELLTGKRRLMGFCEKWKVKRLDELGRWTGGMTPSMGNPAYWQSGTVPWLSSGDVKSVRLTTTALAISEYAIKEGTTTLVPAKSIIVVTRSGILRRYLPVAMNIIPMAINQDIKALLPNGNVQPDYLLHSLNYNGDRILSRCLKSGTTVESIEFRWLKDFTIPIPPLPEQTAIAEILDDMDADISALEAKLAKARHIKQGMMQELLTGRIRLI